MSKRRGSDDEAEFEIGEHHGGSKRRAMEVEDQDAAERRFPSRRRGEDSPDFIHLRVLVANREAVAVIGRQGHMITRIRDDCGIQLNVSDNIQGSEDRIVNLRGTAENVAKGAGLIVRALFNENFDEPSSLDSRYYQMRILFPNLVMGALIGRQGSRFREIEEASAAKLKAHEQLLPFSTDRYLVVYGVADAVHIAVYYLAMAYIDQREKLLSGTKQKKFDPAYMIKRGLTEPQHHFPDYFSERRGGGGGPRYSHSNSHHQQQQQPQQRPRRMRPPPPPPPPFSREEAAVESLYDAQMEARDASPGEEIVQNLRIPNEYAGPVIGKGGQKLRDIRHHSGAKVTMDPTVDENNTRLLTIEGMPASNKVAIYMVHQKIEREKQKQDAGQIYRPPQAKDRDRSRSRSPRRDEPSPPRQMELNTPSSVDGPSNDDQMDQDI